MAGNPASRAGRLARACAAVVLAAVALAPAAEADTEAFLDGSTLRVVGGVFQRQTTGIRVESGFYRVTESSPSGPRVDPGAGCFRVELRDARCSLSGVNKIEVDAKDLDDTVTLNGTVTVPAFIFAGEGDDRMTGGAGPDQFGSISAGRDGSDLFQGGGGIDQVRYLVRSFAVTASLDGNANDGQNGENDSITGTIENVIGGNGDDTLIGDDGPNELIGGKGNDDITGAGGADDLKGLAGDDILRDDLDRIRDTFGCGEGSLDQAFLDLVDTRSGFPTGDCEQVFASAVDQHPNVQIRVGATVGVSRRGRVRLALRCPRRQRNGCSGRLKLRRKSKTLGSKRYSLRPGRRTTATMKLRSRDLARIPRRRGVLARATAREKDPKGRPKTTIATFRLKRRG